MGVEQDGLGVGVIVGVFYEVEARRAVAQGNSCCAQEQPCALAGGREAILRRFIAMELSDGAPYTGASCYHFGWFFIDEEQHGRDKGWQAPRQLGRALRRYGAGAGRVKHKPDGIGACCHGGVYVLLARQAADLDAGARSGWG